MSDHELPEITDDIPEQEREAEASHTLLIDEDGEIEGIDDGDS
jgi:hypothetical protein